MKKYEEIEDDMLKLEDALKDIEAKSGCFFKGTFDLDKVNGNFHISFHNAMPAYQKLATEHSEAWDQVNLSYKIDRLFFGLEKNESTRGRFQELVKELNLSTMLASKEFEHKSHVEEHFMAHHYLEIIPFSFSDSRDGFKYRSYENSFNRKTTAIKSEERMSSLPILLFQYRFSALSSKYETSKKSMGHFLVEVLGLVGAVIAIVGFLQSKVNSCFA